LTPESRDKIPKLTDYQDTLQDTLRAIGARARQLRLMRKWRQVELADRAGVAVATIHRFEKTGASSIENVLRIATALEAEAAFDKLFEAPAYVSLDEALARPEAAARRRAPRHAPRQR
jgi:transcriptional regulator with XRE-family HTH domain